MKPVKLSELSRCVRRQVGRAAPPATGSQLPEALRQKSREIFDYETPIVLTALDTALAGADWVALEARAHCFKNSAHALGEPELAALCETLCVAARAPTAFFAATQLAMFRVRLRALNIAR
ncbi:MAG: Hpt domain-containing protein [Undibacterium sp.]|nr:Hpt domain-containing protein [Opitutaceae bacterium]